MKDIIRKSDFDTEELAIFSEYTRNRFENTRESNTSDSGFLEIWDKIVSYSEIFGAGAAINQKICPKRPITFNSPDTLDIRIYDSFAGKIPVISAENTADFEELVTNIVHKGIRPYGIEKTGASFVSGKTTRFIIISAKPYSNVPAAELGLNDEDNWRDKSVLLRLAHECTHYFTKQTFGISNNILHDELMADFIGIYETFGFYKAEWFLRFMGIIEGSGSRFLVYTNGLPEKVRKAVSELAVQSAENLEKWSNTDSFKAMSTAERIKRMCISGLDTENLLLDSQINNL
jgi:hypothetical protein